MGFAACIFFLSPVRSQQSEHRGKKLRADVPSGRAPKPQSDRPLKAVLRQFRCESERVLMPRPGHYGTGSPGLGDVVFEPWFWAAMLLLAVRVISKPWFWTAMLLLVAWFAFRPRGRRDRPAPAPHPAHRIQAKNDIEMSGRVRRASSARGAIRANGKAARAHPPPPPPGLARISP